MLEISGRVCKVLEGLWIKKKLKKVLLYQYQELASFERVIFFLMQRKFIKFGLEISVACAYFTVVWKSKNPLTKNSPGGPLVYLKWTVSSVLNYRYFSVPTRSLLSFVPNLVANILGLWMLLGITCTFFWMYVFNKKLHARSWMYNTWQLWMTRTFFYSL